MSRTQEAEAKEVVLSARDDPEPTGRILYRMLTCMETQRHQSISQTVGSSMVHLKAQGLVGLIRNVLLDAIWIDQITKTLRKIHQLHLPKHAVTPGDSIMAHPAKYLSDGQIIEFLEVFLKRFADGSLRLLDRVIPRTTMPPILPESSLDRRILQARTQAPKLPQ